MRAQLAEGRHLGDVLAVRGMRARPMAKVLVVSGLALAGCDGCRNDHPYVPYAIGDGGGPSDAGSSAPAPATASATAFGAADAGEVAPPSSTLWETNGLRLHAPEGHHFEHGLFADLDGDGKTDAVVVVRSFSEPTRFATYLFASTRDAPFPLTTATLPVSPRGPARHALTRVGRAQLFVAIGVGPADTTQGARKIAFVELTTEQGKPLAARVRMEVSVADPKDAPDLEVAADPSDRDGDGTPDLAISFGVVGSQGPVRASMRFFDRPAGLARDPDAPRAELAALGRTARERAKKPKDAIAALSLVASGVALAKAVCPELPGARTSGWTNVDAPRCHADEALADLVLAEVVAYASLARPFAAMAALGRFRGPFLSRTKEREKEAEKALEGALPSSAPREVKVLRATPIAQKRHVPSWGVLAFADDTSLDVLTQDGVVRVSLPSMDERKSDTPAWPTAILADGGARLVEVYDACKGGKLRATFTPRTSATEGEPHDVVFPLEAALVPPCTTSRGEPAEVVPVSLGPKGLELLVAGDLVHVEPALDRARVLDKPLFQTGPKGAASSPDGTAIALATPSDVVVVGKSGARRVRGGGLGANLTSCTISNDESKIACVDAGKVEVGFLK